MASGTNFIDYAMTGINFSIRERLKLFADHNSSHVISLENSLDFLNF